MEARRGSSCSLQSASEDGQDFFIAVGSSFHHQGSRIDWRHNLEVQTHAGRGQVTRGGRTEEPGWDVEGDNLLKIKT